MFLRYLKDYYNFKRTCQFFNTKKREKKGFPKYFHNYNQLSSTICCIVLFVVSLPPKSLSVPNNTCSRPLSLSQSVSFLCLPSMSEVAQSIERATPGEEVVCSIPAVAARSQLTGSVSVHNIT